MLSDRARHRARVRRLLREEPWVESEPVADAIVLLADGDDEETRILLDAARRDPRDVLMWAEDRRRGIRRAPPDPELIRRLEAFVRPDPPAREPGVAVLVLVDAGRRGPELVKAVRAQTGLALAEADALLDALPATLVRGISAHAARELQAEIAGAGGRAEIR